MPANKKATPLVYTERATVHPTTAYGSHHFSNKQGVSTNTIKIGWSEYHQVQAHHQCDNAKAGKGWQGHSMPKAKQPSICPNPGATAAYIPPQLCWCTAWAFWTILHCTAMTNYQIPKYDCQQWNATTILPKDGRLFLNRCGIGFFNSSEGAIRLKHPLRT